MFIEILKYGFLVLFFATAIIGIASLPGWIKIPEYYRKRIFIFLILEVVGAIVIFFNQEMIDGSRGIPAYYISDENWIVLDDSAYVITPEIIISTQDTSITKMLGQTPFKKFEYLKNKITPNGMDIMNGKDLTLGTISMQQLEQVGLFNSIETAKGEISSSENYTYVRWKKSLSPSPPPSPSPSPSESNWKRSGTYLAPYFLQVYDQGGQTKYLIKNATTNDTLFLSDSHSKNLFDTDNRIIHFFEHERIYYLLRIAQADLTDTLENYAQILQIRLNPHVKTNENTAN